jgi:hypothetical protein
MSARMVSPIRTPLESNERTMEASMVVDRSREADRGEVYIQEG